LIALIGVPWTLWQAWRARTAAEAARDAARTISRRRTLLDAISGLPGYVSMLDDLESQLAGGDWKKLANVVRLVRRELLELQEHRASFTADENTMLQSTIASLGNLDRTLRNTDAVVVGSERIVELRNRLSERADELHRLHAMLRNRAVEDRHDIAA
jgi:hypothetical protein